jgi:3-phenylpropionate/trans-cinnamate dioxygenase ferredoxin subunit
MPNIEEPSKAISIRICSISEIPKDGGKSFMIGNYRLAVFNSAGKYYASSDTCSHEEESLAEGWLEEDKVECPRHGAQFCLRTGEALTLPATKPIEVFEVEISGDDLFVRLPESYKQ